MKKWYLLVALMLGLASIPCQAAQETISTLLPTEYQTIFQAKDEKVYILTFTADWCKPCQDFKKNVLLPLVEKYATQEKFQFYLVNMTKPGEADLQFANQLQVDRYPTLVVLHNGDSTVVQVGYDKEKGSSEIEKMLATYK